jgi:hypothetical protein
LLLKSNRNKLLYHSSNYGCPTHNVAYTWAMVLSGFTGYVAVHIHIEQGSCYNCAISWSTCVSKQEIYVSVSLTAGCEERFILKSVKNVIILQLVKECYVIVVCERMLWYFRLRKNVMILQSVEECYDIVVCERSDIQYRL